MGGREEGGHSDSEEGPPESREGGEIIPPLRGPEKKPPLSQWESRGISPKHCPLFLSGVVKGLLVPFNIIHKLL